jgi:hypothetical protein
MSEFQDTIQIYFHKSPKCSSRNGVVDADGVCHAIRDMQHVGGEQLGVRMLNVNIRFRSV